MKTSNNKLTNLLKELHTELVLRNSSDWQAFAKLKPNRYGWVELAYSDESDKMWEEALREDPDNLNAIHHLCISCHARAFDLEDSSSPSLADEQWKRALEYCFRLWQADKFWKELAGRLDKGVPNPFPQVRENWPEQALQVHFDIAFDERCKNYRARQHIQFALNSPFPQEIKDSIRRKTYERVTGHLPPVVWESTTFDPKTIEPAIKAITTYLDLDEEFLPALTELLSLLTKLQTGHVQQTNVIESPFERQRKLNEVKIISNKYDPYVKRIERFLTLLETNDLSYLVLWLSRVGQALKILGEYEAAAGYYSRALAAAGWNEMEPWSQEEMHREWLHCILQTAHDYAALNEYGGVKARKLLESIKSEKQLTAECLCVRGKTHYFLGEFDKAEIDYETALLILNEENYEADIRLRPECEEMLERIELARRQEESRGGMK